MMLPEQSEEERPTYEPVDVANVLAVGCSEAVIARCWAAAGQLDVMLRSCSALMAPSIAAARKPLAIVLPNELHLRNADEFDALARDVAAITVLVDDDVSSRELEAMLGAVIRTCTQRRESLATRSSLRPPPMPSDRPPPSAGRYAVIHVPEPELDPGDRATPRGVMLPAPPDRPSRSGTRRAVTGAEPTLPVRTSEVRRG